MQIYHDICINVDYINDKNIISVLQDYQNSKSKLTTVIVMELLNLYKKQLIL